MYWSVGVAVGVLVGVGGIGCGRCLCRCVGWRKGGCSGGSGKDQSETDELLLTTFSLCVQLIDRQI